MRVASIVLLAVAVVLEGLNLAATVRHARHHRDGPCDRPAVFGPPCCGPRRGECPCCPEGCKCCPHCPCNGGPAPGRRVMPRADDGPDAPPRCPPVTCGDTPRPVGERWVMPRADGHAYTVFSDMLRAEE